MICIYNPPMYLGRTDLEYIRNKIFVVEDKHSNTITFNLRREESIQLLSHGEWHTSLENVIILERWEG